MFVLLARTVQEKGKDGGLKIVVTPISCFSVNLRMQEDRARGDKKNPQNCKKASSLTEQFSSVVNTQNATVVLMLSGGRRKDHGRFVARRRFFFGTFKTLDLTFVDGCNNHRTMGGRHCMWRYVACATDPLLI